MADVTLTLKVDNSDYIKKMTEADNISHKVYETVQNGSKRALGLIEKETEYIRKLTEIRDRAQDINKIAVYNKHLEESKKKLNEIEQAGVKTQKTTSALITAFIKLGTAIAAAFSVQKVLDFIKVTAIAYNQQIQAERKLLNALDGRERIQKRLIAQAKGIQKATLFSDEDIINAQAFLAAQGRTEEQIKKTINAAVQLATVMGTDLQSATDQLSMTYEGTIGRLARIDGRLKGLTTEQLLNGAAVDLLGEKYKGFAEVAVTVGLGSVNQLKTAWGELKEVFGEFWVELLKATGISEKMKEQMEGTTIVLQDKNIPLYKRWLAFFGIGTKETLKQVVIDTKKSNEDLVKTEEEKYAERIAAYKKFMETLRGLREKKGQLEQWFSEEELKAQKFFNDYWDKQDKQEIEKREKALDDQTEFYKLLFEQNQKAGKLAFELLQKNVKDLEDAEEKVAQAKQKNLAEAGEAVLNYISIIDELAQREIEETQRNRELLDTRISDTQQALETEIELYKAGYASNVAAKQKQLEDLKKQRELALLDEEKARKKEHTLKVVQLLAEQAVAIAKVIMSAEVAKMEARAMMANPITLIPGAALLASVKISEAISIAAIVASAVAASLSKFAKGGWTGDGAMKDETGERVAGMVHEKEFVIHKGPAGRFRGVLEAINKEDNGLILNRFNKIFPELTSGNINNVTVNNSGSNSRLDQVITEQRIMNKRLAKDQNILISGGKKIITKGNKTRITG